MVPLSFVSVSKKFLGYFHPSYSLYGQVLCYANDITLQDHFYFKNCIPDFFTSKFNDYRSISTSKTFFSRLLRSIYVTD